MCAEHAGSTTSANRAAGVPKVRVRAATLGGGESLKTGLYANAIAGVLADRPGQRSVLVGLRHPEGQVAKATCHPCLSGHARVQLPLPEAPPPHCQSSCRLGRVACVPQWFLLWSGLCPSCALHDMQHAQSAASSPAGLRCELPAGEDYVGFFPGVPGVTALRTRWELKKYLWTG